MQGTQITITATTPFAFGEDEAAKATYAEWVTAIVDSHGARDVSVTVGDAVSWDFPSNTEPQDNAEAPATAEV